MIYLFDTNEQRAKATAEVWPEAIRRWDGENWLRVIDKSVSIPPELVQDWFLLHDSNTEQFLSMLNTAEKDLKNLPTIRFTGGDPTGKPANAEWIRYRFVSAENGFGKEELEALNTWVQGGRKNDVRPWLLFEDKPHYTRGLLILLRLARQPGMDRASTQNRQWWKDRLATEENWDAVLLHEISRRMLPTASKPVEDFVAWVNGDGALLGAPFDRSNQPQSEPTEDQLDTLINILRRVV